jgi:alkanesulfonate monooxygenase SsuD/methylene tetrahydromethanopterin reductase-like flavin-dependent oxidoreductase (luciferase family)
VIDIGLGLWTMQSTAEAPRAHVDLYRDLRDDARAAERLGFHSIWTSEHHFWYDGWCPSPLLAATTALAATRRLHVGTGVHVLPLHEPARTAAAASAIHRLCGGRFELGVGLGYRDPEFDGFGIPRSDRGARMDAALTELTGRFGIDGPPIWVGGFAGPALARAARHGLSLILPQTVSDRGLGEAIADRRQMAAAAGMPAGRVAAMRYAWVTDGSEEASRRAKVEFSRVTREYQGAWWSLQGKRGFDVPDLLEAQLDRAAATALVGTGEEIRSDISRLEKLGVDLVVLLVVDGDRDRYRLQIEELAAASVARRSMAS